MTDEQFKNQIDEIDKAKGERDFRNMKRKAFTEFINEEKRKRGMKKLRHGGSRTNRTKPKCRTRK